MADLKEARSSDRTAEGGRLFHSFPVHAESQSKLLTSL